MVEDRAHRKFRCPSCRGIFPFEADRAGEVSECPGCAGRVRLPGPPKTCSPPEPGRGATIKAPSAARPRRDRAGPSLPRSRAPRATRGPSRRAAAGYRGADLDHWAKSYARIREIARRSLVGSKHMDLDRWAKTHAMVWGIVLIAGTILPEVGLVGPVEWNGDRLVTGGVKLVWPPVFLREAGSAASVLFAAGLLLAAGLGVLSVVAGRRWKGKTLGRTLLLGGAGTLLLYFPLRGPIYSLRIAWPGEDAIGAVFSMLLMLLATPLIASGNHLRKAAPGAAAPRVLTGIGGIMLLLGFLLPVWDGNPLIGFALNASVSSPRNVLSLCLLGVLAYGVLGVVSSRSVFHPGVAAASSVIARLVMGLAPILAATVISRDPSRSMEVSFWGWALDYLKDAAILYGLLAITAVGLAAWVGKGVPGVKEEAEDARA